MNAEDALSLMEPWLRAVARSLVHGADVDDVTQEGRIAVWRAWGGGRLDPERDPFPYLRVRALGAMRTARSRGGFVSQWHRERNGYVVTTHDEAPDRATQDDYSAMFVRDYLSRIPPREAAALASRLDGYASAEVCDAMGVTEARVRQLARRGAERLREEITCAA